MMTWMQGNETLIHWKFHSWVQTQLAGQRKDISFYWTLVCVRDHGGPKDMLLFFYRWGDWALDIWVANPHAHGSSWDCTTACPPTTFSAHAHNRHKLSVSRADKAGSPHCLNTHKFIDSASGMWLLEEPRKEVSALHCWGLCKNLLISWKRNRKKNGLL